MPNTGKSRLASSKAPARRVNRKTSGGSPSPGLHAESKFAIAILAAGKGTRLKSRHPKVLHRIGGRPLLEHVVRAARQVVDPTDIFAVIGREAERVRQALAPTGINFVLQTEQRGTGHAIMQAHNALANYDFFLVLSGDVPLIRPDTIRRVRDFHLHRAAAMTILTAEPDDPSGYGRIVRRKKGGRTTDVVAAIVEQKSATSAQLKLREINSGIYAFSSRPLFAHLDELTTDNPHQEFYLTDMAAILTGAGETVAALPASDPAEVMGINTRLELARLDSLLRSRKADELMAAGVTIYRPETCMIDSDVSVAPDTVIDPFVQLLGKTSIGNECHIGSYSVVTDCELGNHVTVRPGCILSEACVAEGAVLGPFSHLRPGADVGTGAHVGNFVELKKTRLGNNSKANHLAYLGDATIGDNVNIGAGTITCNYDGVLKHPTRIGNNVFIGSDSILVAPVTIAPGAYVGAASCITSDVPEDALALSRSPQVNKLGWAKKKREQRQAAGNK